MKNIASGFSFYKFWISESISEKIKQIIALPILDVDKDKYSEIKQAKNIGDITPKDILSFELEEKKQS